MIWVNTPRRQISARQDLLGRVPLGVTATVAAPCRSGSSQSWGAPLTFGRVAKECGSRREQVKSSASAPKDALKSFAYAGQPGRFWSPNHLILSTAMSLEATLIFVLKAV